MLITDGLRGEHAVIVAELGALERLITDEETPARVQGRIELVGESIVEHARVEDELLFGRLEAELPPGGPLEKMREEHDRLEQKFTELAETDEVETIERELPEVLRLARGHFDREEKMLFPQAERSLDEQTLEEIGGQWAERREVHLPRGPR